MTWKLAGRFVGALLLLAFLAWLVFRITTSAAAAYKLWALPPVPPASSSEGRWDASAHDLGGTRFSPLTQLNPSNVSALRPAWRYSTGEIAYQAQRHASIPPSFQTTPILVGRLLIGCTHTHRVFAVDAGTGKLVWRFDPQLKTSEAGDIILKCRGVSTWTDPGVATDQPCATRVLLAAGLSLYALDARTGTPCLSFGNAGHVTVSVKGLEFADELTLRSPVLVVGRVIIVGSAIVDIYRLDAPSGMVRAFDAQSGRALWTFDPVPRDPRDPARRTWGKGSADYVGSANMWSFMSADPSLGLAYIPTTSPSDDYYGAARPGDNVYANSLVALDINTGRVRWWFQTTHHDVWDTDLPAQPILTNITKGGQLIPAVVQVTKQGQIFVLDRRNGRPIYPVVERPVWTRTDVPGEVLSRTQPFSPGVQSPVRMGITPDDAWGFTFVDRQACKRKIAALETHGPFTPPTLHGSAELPALAGGMNWSGAAVTPGGLLIVPSLDLPASVRLVPRGGGAGGRTSSESGGAMLFPMKGAPYEAEVQFLLSPLGAPCNAPPWASITAIDLTTGRQRWSVPLGTIEQFTPVIGIPLKLGSPFSGGPIVTAGGLAFMAGTNDSSVRAFDLSSGRVVWRGALPAAATSIPMTYALDGRQFVVVAAGGGGLFPGPKSDQLVAFALPADKISRTRVQYLIERQQVTSANLRTMCNFNRCTVSPVGR